jgi:putative oxidoreductase
VCQSIRATEAGWGLAVLRIVLGVIFAKEGAGKLLGWFGGSGFAGTCAFFAGLGIPFPEFNAILVGTVELVGGLALVLGFLTRLAVVPIAITMGVAILTAHRGGGWSYPLLVIAACGALLQVGAGPLSLDRALSGKGSVPGRGPDPSQGV